MGGLGSEEDRIHTVNFREDTGEQVTVGETSSLTIFVAPVDCEIIEIGIVVTTTVAVDGTNFWTINIKNQTGDVELLSTNFNTDSGSSGNGNRALTADTFISLNDNGSGTNYLQNAVLAKGDILILTTDDDSGSGADLKNPTISDK